VRYRYFEQPFKLYYNVEDDSDDDDYYCDETQSTGFTTVKISVFMLTPIAVLENLHI
jgi:hypothetical protein